ncbi:hypothetical protein [Aporhodopirellula aestuarii]|uniref:Uncharacterized protein n=1 Tax=Aporhodopirellula aestuarii TaxID=2950107 RepID=A0ABT0UCQ6_9BACT|nr:hypothetical protein [Aporhodopirellula aestuarii]MCM2374700.1 hypothetical protein [Aporhodopirellula aestuarii]
MDKSEAIEGIATLTYFAFDVLELIERTEVRGEWSELNVSQSADSGAALGGRVVCGKQERADEGGRDAPAVAACRRGTSRGVVESGGVAGDSPASACPRREGGLGSAKPKASQLC